MNIQTPASRRDGPATSHAAERHMNESGKRKRHQDIIAEFVESHPGHTAAEIGEKTGLGQHECSRRLSEMDQLIVQRGMQRRCEVKGSMMATWYPAN